MAPVRRGPDGADRILIGRIIAVGVREGPRRLAQHVEAGGEAAILPLPHPLDRFVDRAAHDENLAHHPHRGADAGADERLAGARDEPAQRRRVLAVAGQRPADDEAPGRGVDQGRVRLALVAAPVALAELVGDQAVGGLGIGDAQERLGEREQGHALLRVQPIFLQELVHPAARLRVPQVGQHRQGPLFDPRARIGVERGIAQQRRQHVRFGGTEKVTNAGARRCRSVSHVGDLLRLESYRRGPRPKAMPIASLDEIRSRVGQEVGVSDWLMVDQARIDGFAEVTEDPQFIHIDPVRAAETPFGGTIAHGFLTLSLLSRMAADAMLRPDGIKMGVNYGFEKVRFIAPVRSGKRVRGRFVLASFEEKRPGQFQFTHNVTVEIEGEDKPALIADWIGQIFT